MPDDDDTALAGISSDAVEDATGRGWAAWLEVLDAAGAAGWDHKEIVAHLEREHPEVDADWWRQSLTVGYELARGKREVGQTADAGYQVGVQRSVAASPAEVWEVLTSRPGLWLGEGAAVAFDEGQPYEVPPGDDVTAARGEVRVVKPGDRLRMTWHPEGWPGPATIQIALTTSASGKTAIRAHAEKLPDAAARELMRARWRAALERVVAALS